MKQVSVEDVHVGQRASATRAVTEADVQGFAAVSGDVNPVHLDEAYAATTPFRTRIAHGMLTASHISAMLANQLPGPGAIYLSQTLQFRRPVKLGDVVETSVEITAIDADKGRITLATVCSVEGKRVLEGEAVVMVARAGGI